MADELVELLAVAHIGHLVHPEVMLLNPNFGAGSVADADLLSGDMLVDLKTTKSAEVSGQTLDQLFGYFLLAPSTRAYRGYGWIATHHAFWQDSDVRPGQVASPEPPSILD